MDIKTIDPIGADPDTGTADTNAPIDLLGLSRDEMCEALIAAGIPVTRYQYAGPVLLNGLHSRL